MPDSTPLAKVLIVNDDPSTLLALSSILSGPDEDPTYTVFLVQSGEEALREVLKHDFAVILLDVSMPGMDGFETADAIRSHPRSASVPIIFITAYYGDELNRMKGYQKGGADYLFAPIIPQVVQTKVAVFVELNLKTQELQRKTAALQAINTDLRYQRMLDLERVNIQLQAEIDERRQAEARGMDLAARDSLTGLFNRQKFLKLVGDHLTESASASQGTALVYINVDNFNAINHQFDSETGDALLKQVAEKLTQLHREEDLLARVGGDEFAVLLKEVATPEQATLTMKKIASALEDVTFMKDHAIEDQRISFSVGLAFHPEDGATADAMFKQAVARARASKQQAAMPVKRASAKTSI